ncbi:MAG TPA: hypothetical protein DDY29_15335 [Rhodobacteraceae bacterium]|nr:hypothetical protein [Paracoccaceae bacterium]
MAEGGDIRPFPDAAAQGLFETPLGLAIDRQDRLWVIDPGGHGFGTPKLVAFDIDTGAVVHEHAFADDIAPWGSFPQDLQVDPPGAIRLYRRCRFLADAPGVDRL